MDNDDKRIYTMKEEIDKLMKSFDKIYTNLVEEV